MSVPAAVARARALRQHITHLGASPEEFTVPITVEEGWEVLRWYQQQLKIQSVGSDEMNLAQLAHDIQVAKRRNDPFYVLQNFALYELRFEPRLH